MSDQSDQVSDDRIKPWTIKGIGPEVRNAAIAAADRAKQPIGEWMSRAIRSQVQTDRQESRAPVPIEPQSAPSSDLGELERLVALTASLSEAGAPPPKAVSRTAYTLIRQRMAGMRGPTKSLAGPTITSERPTKTASSPTSTPDSPTKAASSPTKPPPRPTKAPRGRTK